MTDIIRPGVQVCTLKGETDTDHENQERHTPAGTWGHISGQNHGDHWDVIFPGGGWVVVTEAELRDAAQYKLDEPKSIEQLALSVHWFVGIGQLTSYDDPVVYDLVQIADSAEELANLARESRKLVLKLRGMSGIDPQVYQALEGVIFPEGIDV